MIDMEHDKKIEPRRMSNSCGTGPSTPSSLSDYVTGDADDSSDGRCVVPFTLRSVETQLILSKVFGISSSNLLSQVNSRFALKNRFSDKYEYRDVRNKCRKVILPLIRMPHREISRKWSSDVKTWCWKVRNAAKSVNGLSGVSSNSGYGLKS